MSVEPGAEIAKKCGNGVITWVLVANNVPYPLDTIIILKTSELSIKTKTNILAQRFRPVKH